MATSRCPGSWVRSVAPAVAMMPVPMTAAYQFGVMLAKGDVTRLEASTRSARLRAAVVTVPGCRAAALPSDDQ